MGNASELLRMLEPAVRPVNVPGAPGAAARPGPIESRDFDSLLDEARQMNLMTPPVVPDADAARRAGVDAPANSAPSDTGAAAALSPLMQFDRIENPSLRALIGGSADPAPMKLEH
jgi:hypothetical protein